MFKAMKIIKPALQTLAVHEKAKVLIEIESNLLDE